MGYWLQRWIASGYGAPKVSASNIYLGLDLDNRVETPLYSGTSYEQAASAVNATWTAAPGTGEIWYLNRINIYMEDTGKFQGGYYGAAQALATGITISVGSGTATARNMTPIPITKIGHWGLYAGVDVFYTDFTVGNDIALVRWTWEKGSDALKINGASGEAIRMSVPDNLGAGEAELVSHIANVEGWKVDL